MPASQEAKELKSEQGIIAAFSPKGLLKLVEEETLRAQREIDELDGSSDSISIGKMFKMQLRMNSLSQRSEMATSVVSAANQAILSVTRNLKQ